MKRRSLLKALSAGSLTAMTPLAAMLARSAMAVETQRIRTLFLYHPNGCRPDIFFPKAGPINSSGFAYNPRFDRKSGAMLPPPRLFMSAPLEPVAEHLLYLDGIGYAGEAPTHEGGGLKCLTGTDVRDVGSFKGSSIEVQMGKEDLANRAATGVTLGSIQMGSATQWGDNANKRISFDNGNSLSPEDDPRKLYQTVFGGSVADVNKLQMLARARTDLNRLKTQLGTVELQRLEQHMEAINSLELRLSNVGAGSGLNVATTIKPRVDKLIGGPQEALWNTNAMANVSSIQQDIAIAALSSNVTRTIAMMYGVPVSPMVIPGSDSDNDHNHSHIEDDDGHSITKVWWMAEIRKLIEKMANTPDIGGSLLDNTIICTVSDLGHSTAHNHTRIPMFLAGGKNAGLVHGRSVDLRPLGLVSTMKYGDQATTAGVVRHTNVLMTIAEKAGYKTIKLPTDNGGRINNIWTGSSTTL